MNQNVRWDLLLSFVNDVIPNRDQNGSCFPMDAVTHDKVSEQNVLELLAITIPSRLQYVTTIQSLLRYQLTYDEYYMCRRVKSGYMYD